jgi:hypothetical protein
MENEPTFNDYVALIYNRFDAFVQTCEDVQKMGRPHLYRQESMIVFFMWMQFRRIFQFKTQWRWLKAQPEACQRLGWVQVPDRSTLSRRYKALYPVLQALIAFLAQDSVPLGKDLSTKHLYEDKSLFKARGAVWHQSDRQQGRIPDKVRRLDTDASWSKSAYHGWVYGYGLHLTCNHAGFPVLLMVETAAVSEKEAIASKEAFLLQQLRPKTLGGDNAYTAAKRIRHWARQGVILLTPALRWRNGRYANAYRQFITHPHMARWLRRRKTAIEPVFDLIAKLLGAMGKQKQLAIQHLSNVRTCIALAVFSLQVAMIANNVWNLPFRLISTIQAVFA